MKKWLNFLSVLDFMWYIDRVECIALDFPNTFSLQDEKEGIESLEKLKIRIVVVPVHNFSRQLI